MLFGLLVLSSFALEQGTTGVSSDVKSWFTDVASLSVVVLATVAYLKRIVSITGWVTRIVAVATGVALAFGGSLLGYLADPNWLWFGVQAGLLASGGADTLTWLGGLFRPPASTTTTTVATPKEPREYPGKR